jgi:hypothetical protein
MAAYTTAVNLADPNPSIRLASSLPLALGAAAGGLAGKYAFDAVSAAVSDPARAGAVQAACLFALIAGTIAYTLFKNKIHTHTVKNGWICRAPGRCWVFSRLFWASAAARLT